MRTLLLAGIVSLFLSSSLVTAASNDMYVDYIEQYCDDMLELRRCGTFQPVAVKVQKQAKALLARFVTMQDTIEEIEDFLPRLETQYYESDNRVVKFAAAYYIAYLETYLEQYHGSDDDDDLFASLFEDLDVDFLDSRSTTNRPVKPVVINQSRYVYDDKDSISRGTYRERAVSYRTITRREGGSIEKVRSDQSDVRISKKTITKQRSVLQLMIEAEDEDGHPATEKKGYRMVAVLEDADDEEVIAMRYDHYDNERYFARAIDTEWYDEISFYLLCEDCGGDRFGYAGSRRNRDIADEVTYQIDTDNDYDYDYDDDDDDDSYYCYDRNDRRYRCNRNESRIHRRSNDDGYCYDRYDNRYRCDDDYEDDTAYRYDQLALQQLVASPSRPSGQYQVTTTLSFTNESNRSLSLNVHNFTFSLRAYKEGGALTYTSLINEMHCGNTHATQISLGRNQSCTLTTTFYGVNAREGDQLYVQVQYQGNGYHSNSIATQTIWPYRQQASLPPQQPAYPLLPCPDLSTAVDAWKVSMMPEYMHCRVSRRQTNKGYSNLLPLPNPLQPDYGGPFEIYYGA